MPPMKAINIESVLPGDILFTARPGKVERAIRFFTDGEVSHAMICVQAGSFIDSTQAGVQANNIQREFFEDDEQVYHFRLREPAPPQTIARIVNYARSEIGARYSIPEAVRAVVPVGRRPSRRQFCSRLVARAYAQAGIQLLSDTEYCSPEDLRNSPLLIEVPISMRRVSADEIAWRQSGDSPLAAMQKAHNDLLRAAREVDPNVEALEDIITLLLRDKTADEQIDEAQRSSGFLDVWRLEVETHPWRYIPGQMDESFDETKHPTLRRYCLATVREGYSGGVRFSQNLAILRSANRRAPRQSFLSQIGLYETLEANHQVRREIAYDWLSKNYPADLTREMEQIEPHSEHWFGIVDVVNPDVAATARMVVAAAGNNCVCSVCGDDPSRPYRLANGAQTLSGVPSLRLCDDCFNIRSSTPELWIPFLR
ncbi:hypothetical protein DMC47_27055 [Nostoc sp. 3335mG]|nr:hypothetical protein DMC47_27055 [Nostoc sp. 3335mG]